MSHHTVLPESTTLLGKTSRNKELIVMSSNTTSDVKKNQSDENDTHLDELITMIEDATPSELKYMEELMSSNATSDVKTNQSDEKNDTHLDELFTMVEDGILSDLNYIEDLKKDIDDNARSISDYQAIAVGYAAKLRRYEFEKEALKKLRSEKKVVTYDIFEKRYLQNPPFTSDKKVIILKEYTLFNQNAIERLEKKISKQRQTVWNHKSDAESYRNILSREMLENINNL